MLMYANVSVKTRLKDLSGITRRRSLTVSHLGDLIHCQLWGGGGGESASLRNFAFLDLN